MIAWKWIQVGATVFLSATVAIAVIISSFPIAVVGFGVSVPLVYFATMKAKASGQMIEDELTSKIAGEAALWTFSVVLPVIAVASIVLIIGSDYLGEWAEYSGYTLSAVILILGVIYIAMSLYKSRKMSRDE